MSNFPYYKPPPYSYASFDRSSLKFTNYPVFEQPTPPAPTEPIVEEKEEGADIEQEEEAAAPHAEPTDDNPEDKGGEGALSMVAVYLVLTFRRG